MSTSKKQVKSLRRRQPDTLDMIDQANRDIDFVESFLDLLCAVGEGKRLEAVRHRSITCLCSESKTRIDAIKIFVRSISHWDDSRRETSGKDVIKEEPAAYGILQEKFELFKEFESFEKFELQGSGPMLIQNSRDC